MDENFQHNPNNQNNAAVQSAVNAALKDNKKKSRKKKLVIFIAVAVVIILIVAVSGKDDDQKVETIATTVSLNEDAAAGNKTEKATEAPTTKAAVQKIKPGTAVTVKDLKISYLSCNANYTGYSDYAQPKSGNKVIRVEFNFENLGKDDKSLSGFNCYADNEKCETFIFGVDDYKNPVLETISSGRSTKGIIYYEVPINAKDIELEMEVNFWTDEKLFFVVE